ncbi:hypothetical protein BT69DRAFT_1335144 [Atractiella rhizophila]|nr:hypothetical protein BT69DRAFT_1335144 [Atractiella rhizophila]
MSLVWKAKPLPRQFLEPLELLFMPTVVWIAFPRSKRKQRQLASVAPVDALAPAHSEGDRRGEVESRVQLKSVTTTEARVREEEEEAEVLVDVVASRGGELEEAAGRELLGQLGLPPGQALQGGLLQHAEKEPHAERKDNTAYPLAFDNIAYKPRKLEQNLYRLYVLSEPSEEKASNLETLVPEHRTRVEYYGQGLVQAYEELEKAAEA